MDEEGEDDLILRFSGLSAQECEFFHQVIVPLLEDVASSFLTAWEKVVRDNTTL